MTMMREVEATCPCCQEIFPVYELMSSNNFGGRTTDLHTKAVGFSPLLVVIATCPQCGYSNYGNRMNDATLSEEVRERVLSEIKPQLAAYQEKFPLSLSYAFAARIADWQGAEDQALADLWLKAAWVATYYDDDGADAERVYRLKAIQHFQAMLAEEYNVVVAYLIGELYRRVGRTEQAEAWFNRVIEEASDNESEQDIAQLAREQRDNPREMI